MPKPSSRKDFSRARKQLITTMAEEFDQIFPDTTSQLIALSSICDSRLVDKDSKSQLICSYCSSSKVLHTNKNRAIKCTDCKKKTWITSGTIFEGIKKPKPWLQAIWFLERGMTLNAPELAMISGVVVSTTWEIIQRLSIFIHQSIELEMISVEDKNFVDVVTKRSRLSKSGEHPRADFEIVDQSDLHGQNPEERSNSSTFCEEESDSGINKISSEAIEESLGELTSDQLEILNLLDLEPIQFEDLYQKLSLSVSVVQSSMAILELNGLIVCLPGEHYALSPLYISFKSINGPGSESPSQDPEDSVDPRCLKVTVSGINSYIKETFRGISRKYLQLKVSLSHIDCQRLKVTFYEIFKELRTKKRLVHIRIVFGRGIA